MLGIYGGTFNPIHFGHLRAAEEIVEALELDVLHLVPSANPPHKATSGDEIAPAKLRLDWVTQAIAGNPRLCVDPIEVEREGASYLVETLEALRERHPGEDLVFAVGRDAFVEMGSWRAPERIFALANVLVTTRPPNETCDLSRWLPGCVADVFDIEPEGLVARHREAGTWIRHLPITPLDISASNIRARLRAGRSIRYLVPESVEAAIRASGCYTGRPSEALTAQTRA
jgi:nicotinate-nucleotide adenylyltransferase